MKKLFVFVVIYIAIFLTFLKHDMIRHNQSFNDSWVEAALGSFVFSCVVGLVIFFVIRWKNK